MTRPRARRNQITTYPLFTFPYTAVGEYLDLKGVRLPDLRTRREQYRAIAAWCAANGYERVSVWGFRKGGAPRYSSVTRDGYIGVGPGAGSHLPDGFVLDTFDLEQWEAWSKGAGCRWRSACRSRPKCRAGGGCTGVSTTPESRRPALTRCSARTQAPGLAGRDRLPQVWRVVRTARYELTDAGAFWLHLAQNHFALSYVNTLWTAARATPWPERVEI